MKHQLLLITLSIVLALTGGAVGCGRSSNGMNVSVSEKQADLNAGEIRRMIHEQGNSTNDYNYVFEKLLPLTDRSLTIIKSLLDSSCEQDNRVTIYLLSGIATRCGSDAAVLVPHIKQRLSSTSVCVQLAALRSLHSIGNPAWSTANEVGKCLNSSNAFIRATAAETLSSFGNEAEAYLPRIRTLFETETKDNIRTSYQKAIELLEKKQKGTSTE